MMDLHFILHKNDHPYCSHIAHIVVACRSYLLVPSRSSVRKFRDFRLELVEPHRGYLYKKKHNATIPLHTSVEN